MNALFTRMYRYLIVINVITSKNTQFNVIIVTVSSTRGCQSWVLNYSQRIGHDNAPLRDSGSCTEEPSRVFYKPLIVENIILRIRLWYVFWITLCLDMVRICLAYYMLKNSYVNPGSLVWQNHGLLGFVWYESDLSQWYQLMWNRCTVECGLFLHWVYAVVLYSYCKRLQIMD